MTTKPKYHSLQTIMDNARKHGGNKTPRPERVTVEGEREKLLAPLKAAQMEGK
jgi:hypothetical protein